MRNFLIVDSFRNQLLNSNGPSKTHIDEHFTEKKKKKKHH